MIIQIALKILQRNKQHSLKAIYGLSVSIAIVISLLSIFSGITIQITQIVNLAGDSTSIVIQSPDNELISSEILSNSSSTNIKAIIPILEENIIINHSEQIITKQLTLNLSLYLQNHPDSYIQSGRLPTNNSEFIVSSIVFSKFNLSINDFFLFGVNNKTLVGTIFDNLDLFSTVIFNDNPESVSFISIILENPSSGTTTLNYLQNYLGDQYHVSFAKESTSYLGTIFGEILSKFSLILIIIILISFIRIYFFVMWIIIHNLNDFLLLRIIGYTQFQLLQLILYFALIIGNFGLLVGLFLGLCLPLILSNIVPLVSHLRYIPYIADPSYIIYIIVLINIAIVIGVIKPFNELLHKHLSLIMEA
jgi:ABC-type lipoprotein release transport system permease subunit